MQSGKKTLPPKGRKCLDEDDILFLDIPLTHQIDQCYIRI